MQLIPLTSPPQAVFLLPHDHGGTPLALACLPDGGLLRARFVLEGETDAQALGRLHDDCRLRWPQAQVTAAPRAFAPDLRRAYLYGTTFQQAVWGALANLKPGETVTYRQLTHLVGRPLAARAIGNAVGANPYAPFVPCHRVLATGRGDAAIGGFMRGYSGGIALKRRLLAAEGVMV